MQCKLSSQSKNELSITFPPEILFLYAHAVSNHVVVNSGLHNTYCAPESIDYITLDLLYRSTNCRNNIYN
jgi:hypothetical protein